MSQTRVFRGVTSEVLNRLGEGDAGNYVLDLEPGGSRGRVTRRTGLGDVVLRFDHDVQRSELTVTILKKPALLPNVGLWAAMSNAIENASRGTR